ncbi:MAG: hypothetical protein M1607_01035 [Patescibacteria group bacterium]|nr:hypothetical protein [Patescibacteria group bacterium]
MEQTMHQEFERAGVTIASASGAPLFVKNRIAATTHFPLTVDTATNQLIVTTPAGTKTVAILPDQAVQNMIRNGIVNLINSSNLPPISSDSAEISSDSAQISDVVNLELQNNQLVYRINGIKIHKLLGLVPITTNKTVYVSAETGQLLSQQQSVIANILDFLSR